jgi:formamidopyrimidine-DNA glycosylase
MVENPIDPRIMIYSADRVDKKLVNEMVTNYIIDPKHVHKKNTVTEKKLLSCTVQKIKGKAKYQLLFHSMPNQIITIHLKKNGKCVAKSILDGKECTLQKIFVELTKNRLGLPQLGEHIILYGTHHKQLICEKVKILDSVKQQFGLTSFLF